MAKRSSRVVLQTALCMALLLWMLPFLTPSPTAQQGGATAAGPSTPPPSAEHAVLHRLIGKWSARMETRPGADEKFDKSRATETVGTCCGGLFVLTDLKGKKKKTPRGGRGILGYDPARGRYLMAWADTRSTSLVLNAGDYDEASDTLTFVYEQPDGQGGTRQVREVFAWDGADRRSRTISVIGDNGSESPLLVIEYRRK